MTVVHWVHADPMRDILAVAYRRNTAAPSEVRMRPEVLARVGAHWTDYANRTDALGPGVRIVVDTSLPRFPGFEIHRTPPIPAPREGRDTSR